MRIREGSLVEGTPNRITAKLLGYLSLTKPRVIELLLVTTIPAMLLAHRGRVDPLLILNTLFGGMLAAAGANTLNCVADADIDKKMKRTARRPLARDTVPRSHALVFGLALSIGSFFSVLYRGSSALLSEKSESRPSTSGGSLPCSRTSSRWPFSPYSTA